MSGFVYGPMCYSVLAFVFANAFGLFLLDFCCFAFVHVMPLASVDVFVLGIVLLCVCFVFLHMFVFQDMFVLFCA